MKDFVFLFKRFFRLALANFYSLVGSFIIAVGWSWYHLPRRPHLQFVLSALFWWAVVGGGYQIAFHLYIHLTRRFKRHPFWQDEFRRFLDPLFFIGALFFLVFFFQHELGALIYTGAILLLFFWRWQYYLSRHPDSAPWLAISRAIFAVALFIFATQSAFQYLSYRWFILDAEARIFNIVLFRSLALTALWLFGFAGASIILIRWRGVARYFGLAFWSLIFAALALFWMFNLNVLYYSGLQFGPAALTHLKSEGAADLIAQRAVILPLGAFIIIIVVLALILWRLVRPAARQVAPRYWYFYQGALIIFTSLMMLAFGSLRNTPERVVLNSFFEHYRGGRVEAVLDPALAAKLERFGLRYNLDQFNITWQPTVYSETSTARLLPPRFKATRPNIMIVFLESYSARLTSVYNQRFPGLTPGLEEMAADPNTTIFKKFYNASTPTITGLISLLCSFLPPTGHEEIQNAKKLQRHRLLCLPEVLKENGYRYSAYVTAVPKTFANKNGIFESMGTDQVFGQQELAKSISGPPLSWGFSDHQMFPFFGQLAARAESPFLAMLSTVDTHPPFNLAKDKVPYGAGKNNLLNSFHTTDDAWGKFWQEFKRSQLADNTIVVAIADHAVFPAAFAKDAFPDEAGQLTFYDENTFLIYIPDSVLPKEISLFSSGLDFTPTILHLLGINIPNSFEGHSIFDDRKNYPNLVGMHELGLYINQELPNDKRQVDYNIPSHILCPDNYRSDASERLSLCDLRLFYRWKRAMLEDGRLWKR